ncbi:GapA-binding peptide SR1P [Paenibacillus sp. J2TS4]|uniref:GapA-binding peptide SR1P n=1 Tax=Paenibacillus sp. J2TS4 TaxID=2807194 RepID=UPI001B02FB9B|nr:GapA-binding peptide SR1P [Paenibacillus sp. J2TS4]GIP32490.1 hypothetical protein J2TS4_17000 [Paenibacillus sp. J2TS4]
MNTNEGWTARTAILPLELGTILCRSCGKIIGTIPTEGVKKFYTICEEANCSLAKGVESNERG